MIPNESNEGEEQYGNAIGVHLGKAIVTLRPIRYGTSIGVIDTAPNEPVDPATIDAARKMIRDHIDRTIGAAFLGAPIAGNVEYTAEERATGLTLDTLNALRAKLAERFTTPVMLFDLTIPDVHMYRAKYGDQWLIDACAVAMRSRMPLSFVIRHKIAVEEMSAALNAAMPTMREAFEAVIEAAKAMQRFKSAYAEAVDAESTPAPANRHERRASKHKRQIAEGSQPWKNPNSRRRH